MVLGETLEYMKFVTHRFYCSYH